MRFRLRTLLTVLALGPPIFAGGYWVWNAWKPRPARWDVDSDPPDWLPHYGGGATWVEHSELREHQQITAD